MNVTSALRAFSRDSGKDIVNVIVSSNVTMMKTQPSDAGVAVYFTWDNVNHRQLEQAASDQT